MKKLLLIILALLAGSAQAGTSITTTVASYHADRGAGYNENNPGIGLTHDGWAVGCYENSYYKTSCYVGREFRKPINRYVSAGLQLGAVTGYEASQLDSPSFNGAHAYGLPMLIFGRDVQYMLGVVPIGERVVTLQIDWRL